MDRQKITAYAESLGAGAAVAGLQAAYQALTAQGGDIKPQPVLAAGLLAAMGYLATALRWLATPPTPPSAPAVPQRPVSPTGGDVLPPRA